MPERTISAVYYTTNEGEVFMRGERVDLSDEEASRGDALGAFGGAPMTRSMDDLASIDAANPGGASPDLLNQVRAAIASGDLKLAAKLVAPDEEGEQSLQSVVENGTVQQVLDEVNGDPDKAEEAMGYEEQKDPPRSSLVSELQKIIDAA